MTDDLFDRAREADIEAVAGVKLFRAGRRMRGPCPVCKAGVTSRRRGDGSFWVDPDTGRWGCFAGQPDCGRGGDVIELERMLHGGTPREAAERLAGPGAPTRARPRPAPAGRVAPDTGLSEPSSAERTAARLWRQGVSAGRTPVERYLRARGIEGRVLRAALGRLKYHPSAAWGQSEGRWITAPAMLAAVHTIAGPTGGLHVTYLKADGSGKADLAPAKRMWGPQADAEGRPGGCWLIGPRGTGPLVVGEGIESVLSAAQLLGVPCRAAAALSLNRLQGGWLLDAWGRVDPDCVAGDPEKPPFTWPLEGLDVREVVIALDRDMARIEVKARKPMGGTHRVALDADARARICGGLAQQAWRAANPQLAIDNVQCIAPAPGRDFNNELRAISG